MKTPLPTASSGHRKSLGRTQSAVKHKVKIAKDARTAPQKSCKSLSCTSTEKFTQMETGWPQGILSENLNS